jgi:hypothetical protein
MECPVCGSGLNVDLSGEAFCVTCESRSQNIYHGELAPGIFDNWQRFAWVSFKVVCFGLLVYAAVYELARW